MNMMMFKEGSKLEITSINSDANTRKRMRSFGINVGSEIIVQHYSIGDNNIEILTGGGLIALRRSEANDILCKEQL